MLGSNNRRTIKLVKFNDLIKDKIALINQMPKVTDDDKREIENAWFEFIKSLGHGY